MSNPWLARVGCCSNSTAMGEIFTENLWLMGVLFAVLCADVVLMWVMYRKDKNDTYKPFKQKE